MLSVTEKENMTVLKLNRAEKQNSLNTQLLKEIQVAFDNAEKNPACKLIIIEGGPEIFCSGMDLHEIITIMHDANKLHAWTSLYMSTLKRFTTSSKLVIAHVKGKAIAGGVGLVAASDLVIASEAASFKLTELFWGLLPAMVAPFLIRRMGFQKAYSMALTCQTLSANDAHFNHLVDACTDHPEQYIDPLMERFHHIANETVVDLKSYFQKIWIITDEMEKRAIDKTTNLLQRPAVQKSIRDFVEHHKLPWK